MQKYGFGYQGGKTKIAEEIINILPAGERFVDLFGGGAAMTHCACVSGKYKSVLYNDVNPLCVQLFNDALNGRFAESVFTPEFISREEFFKRKDVDGYVKYVWSFGNDGKSYIYGKHIEPVKRELHNLVVFGMEPDRKIFSEYGISDIDDIQLESQGIKQRRLELKKKLSAKLIRCDMEALKRIENLQNLVNIGRLQALERIEALERIDYSAYVYKSGDIVYCDPPYQNVSESQKKCYLGELFDNKRFFDWVASRDYPVYFSNYEINDDRFVKVWSKEIKSTLSATNNACLKTEYLYWNGR